jgi:hypothetical protein
LQHFVEVLPSQGFNAARAVLAAKQFDAGALVALTALQHSPIGS